eukprot:850781-Pleurochrysis_carterae.AAC.1
MLAGEHLLHVTIYLPFLSVFLLIPTRVPSISNLPRIMACRKYHAFCRSSNFINYLPISNYVSSDLRARGGIYHLITIGTLRACNPSVNFLNPGNVGCQSKPPTPRHPPVAAVRCLGAACCAAPV